MNGQPTVRYVYPVNYQNQCQHQMSGDMPAQTYPPCSTQGYGNQYGTSYNSYPVVASQAMDTFVNYSQTTYPVAQSENNMTYSSYPVQYSSGQPSPSKCFTLVHQIYSKECQITHLDQAKDITKPLPLVSRLSPVLMDIYRLFPRVGSSLSQGILTTPRHPSMYIPQFLRFKDNHEWPILRSYSIRTCRTSPV